MGWAGEFELMVYCDVHYNDMPDGYGAETFTEFFTGRNERFAMAAAKRAGWTMRTTGDGDHVCKCPACTQKTPALHPSRATQAAKEGAQG